MENFAVRYYVVHGSKPKSNRRWAVIEETIERGTVNSTSKIVADRLTLEQAQTERDTRRNS